MRLRNVSKVFGPDPKRAIPLLEKKATREEILKKTGLNLGVADVEFDVKKGEILVIMGLSGSGKSTLVRCVNRLIEPTTGQVFIDDEDVLKMDQKQLRYLRQHKVGMVFQRFALFPHRTVCQNTEYGLEITGVDRETRRKKAFEVLELVGLKGWEDRYPGQLSGGMQQRVGLARALAADPEIVLMDEALSALDPLIRKDMQNEIIDLQRKLGKTILFISHDLDEAINMGDRIILMKDGRIVQSGTAEEILTNPASHYVERFVEDVDFSKVLTAGTVMKKVHEVVHTNDGPKVAVHKLREAGLSTLFAVDAHGKLQGIVRIETASAIAKGEESDAGKLIDPEVRSVDLGTSLQDIVPLMAERRDPVAVVDENQRIKGVIVVGTLLASLTEGSAGQ